MKSTPSEKLKTMALPVLAGVAVFALALLLTTGIASAASPAQDTTPPPADEGTKDCADCHLDIAESWSQSSHAHAYDNVYFQEQWTGLGSPDECLACHTTNFVASTGEYTQDGIHCQACHGETSAGHPPEVVPVYADAEYCGECHTTTLSEWKTTIHASVGVGCMACHDPHSQQPLFEVKDDLCLNCHQEEMDHYLEDLHIQKGVGCVDCHALVVPPESPPDDGIIPTGHAFTITPATCVACHTDALHAGIPLPGYENGATGNYTPTESISGTEIVQAAVVDTLYGAAIGEESGASLTPEQKIQTLETALASRNITLLFQGGIVGLVLGGSTAWIVARNVRRVPSETEENSGGNDEKKEGSDGTEEDA